MKNRSLLYTPAINMERLAKSVNRSADVVIIDLEDSVLESQFNMAISNTLSFLNSNMTNQRIWVRINSDRVKEQLDICKHNKVEIVVLPKVSDRTNIENLIQLTGDKIQISALIEDAKGVLNANEIAKHQNVVQLQLGEVDLRTDLLNPNSASDSIYFARQMIIFAGTAHTNSLPIGPVNQNFKDLDSFRMDCISLRSQGYFGRTCIHPDQVKIVNEVFNISNDELMKANVILNNLGNKAVAIDDSGQMIDLAHERWAKRIIDLA